MKKSLIIYTLVGYIIMIFIVINVACTTNDDRTDIEKRTEFESLFEPGMSQYEVEQVLNEVAGKYINDDELDSGDYFLRYGISYEVWGAETYVFRFTPDGHLKIAYPIIFGE